MRPGLYAFAVAAAFRGVAIYIGAVEQPARLNVGGRAMLKNDAELSSRHADAVRLRRHVRCPRFHPFQARWRRALDHRRHHDSGELAICIFCDDAGEHLALRHVTWTGDLPGPQADAALGIAGMGSGIDRFRCLLLVRLGA